MTTEFYFQVYRNGSTILCIQLCQILFRYLRTSFLNSVDTEYYPWLSLCKVWENRYKLFHISEATSFCTFVQLMLIHCAYKTVQDCFCRNFVKFPPILNTLKCNYLTPLRFKGLSCHSSVTIQYQASCWDENTVCLRCGTIQPTLLQWLPVLVNFECPGSTM